MIKQELYEKIMCWRMDMIYTLTNTTSLTYLINDCG